MKVKREQLYKRITELVDDEFSDIVIGHKTVEGKLRLILTDGSFMDIWISEKRKGVYAYHWEREMVDGTIYRHNNLPDLKARKLKTFPKHFHDKQENVIKESSISDKPDEGIRDFLKFTRGVIKGV